MSDDKKPETTEGLKEFLNNDPDDLPEAQVDDIPTAPGGADADVNESDVGRGESDDLVTRDQPLAAQTDEDDLPDEIQEPGADADNQDATGQGDEDTKSETEEDAEPPS